MNILVGLLGTLVSAILAPLMNKAVAGGWKKVTGEAPPVAADPDASTRKVLIWAVLSAAGVAVVQVLASRVSARAKRSLTQ